MATSKLSIFYRLAGTTVAHTGMRVWAHLAGTVTFDINTAIELVENATKLGLYESAVAVADTDYDIWVDTSGGVNPIKDLVNRFHGDKRLSTIADHFDSADSYRLKKTGISDQTVTVVSTISPTPDYLGQPGRDALGVNYVAIALAGDPLWEVAGSGLTNPMTDVGDMILGGVNGTAVRIAKGNDNQILQINPTSHVPVWSPPTVMTAQYDMIIGGVSGAPEILTKGTEDQVLTAGVGGEPIWATPAFVNPMTSVGDMLGIGQNGSVARLPIGADEQLLKSVEISPGVIIPQWVDVSAVGMTNPMTAQGDLIRATVAGAPQKIPKGTNGQVLKMSGGVPGWGAQLSPEAQMVPLQFEKLGFPQSLYLNVNSDNEDYSASKLTVLSKGLTYITVSIIPNVQEILAANQYEVFIYNTSSGSDGQSCDYTQRAVVVSGDRSTWRIYVDDVSQFSVGDTIALNVHYRDTDWYPSFTPDVTDNSKGNSFAGCFVNGDGDLVAMTNATNASGIIQTMAYKSDNDYLDSFTAMNSSSAVIPASGLYAGGILIVPRPYRIGGQNAWISPCMIRPTTSDIWEIAVVSFNDDFSNTTVYGKFTLPDPPAGAPVNGWTSPTLARRSAGGWKLFVVSRTNAANSDMVGGTGHYRTWTVEEYHTEDQDLGNSPTWTWVRTVFDPANIDVSNDVSFVHGYIDSVTYFEHEGAEFLLVGGTTWKAKSGIGSNRSFGFMQFNGSEWVVDRHGATIVNPAKHLDLTTGTKYDDLTYLNDHLGGYPQLMSYKGLSYLFFSSKSTGNYYVGLAKLKSGIEFKNEGDLLTQRPFNDDRRAVGLALIGTKDGVNQTFTMPRPFKEDSEELFLDGRRLTKGVAYTISGLTVTCVTFAPLASEEFLTDFTKE